jgi:glutamate--cysteine ligase
MRQGTTSAARCASNGEMTSRSRRFQAAFVTTPATSPMDEPIRSAADLLGVFLDARKPRDQWRVGAEMEKFGVFTATGEPLQYAGPRGVVSVMEALSARFGWVPEAEKEDGPVLALMREGAQVTLEPGSQLELSGTPFTNVHQVCSEFGEHRTQLTDISREFGITWLGLGFHPFAKRSDLGFIPKARYAIMREYLPTRGGLALDMMLRTCTVQGNFDFDSEADAIQKMRVGLKLAPLTTAMFANSPWYEGAPHGGVSYRGKVWLDVDPDRSGLVPPLLEDGGSFERYVEWALDVPMFLIKRGADVIANTGQTFRSFWKSGYEGHHATQGDWQLHLNTLFPEVRLKKTIEIRGADAQGTSTRCAVPALWTGLYYDRRALDEADALTHDWKHEELVTLRHHVWREGLRAPFRGKPLAEVAQRVVEIAEDGLERRAQKRNDGKDERVHLVKLRELAARGLCPADRLLVGMEEVQAGGAFRREVIKRADLLARQSEPAR